MYRQTRADRRNRAHPERERVSTLILRFDYMFRDSRGAQSHQSTAEMTKRNLIEYAHQGPSPNPSKGLDRLLQQFPLLNSRHYLFSIGRHFLLFSFVATLLRELYIVQPFSVITGACTMPMQWHTARRSRMMPW